MDFKLELIIVPVTDIDRAKAFYIERAGFGLDVDHSAGDHFRIVQLTPPGSHCSITLMREPERAGSLTGLHLIVEDIEAAQAELTARELDADGPFHFEDGRRAPGPDPERHAYGSFLSFRDPDGNHWLIQEVRARPDR